MRTGTLFFMFLMWCMQPYSQSITDLQKEVETLKAMVADYEHSFEKIEKIVDDQLWFARVGDVAFIDKVFICGPAKAVEPNPTSMSAGNPLKFWSYVFVPLNIDLDKKYPLIVLPHGGVHGNFSTYHTHIVRELIAQGYVVVAPEYRGSNGYGKSFWKSIDYGGLEVDDVTASRDYMVDNYDFVDDSRVGIIGWSHGGLISLFSVFNHPQKYKVAYAGVPVSDLVARMGYYDDEYRELFSAKYHIGKTAQDNIAEYRRRSPAWNTSRFSNTPLLIYTNTNDDDVNVLEVEHLIKSLKADGKTFTSEVFKDIPGGHSFDRIDPKQSREIRLRVWQFLAKQLNPPTPIHNMKEMAKASYYPVKK